MKKAFEQNVSRAKPRLRLGAFTGAVDPTAPDGADGSEGASAVRNDPTFDPPNVGPMPIDAVLKSGTMCA